MYSDKKVPTPENNNWRGNGATAQLSAVQSSFLEVGAWEAARTPTRKDQVERDIGHAKCAGSVPGLGPPGTQLAGSGIDRRVLGEAEGPDLPLGRGAFPD